MENKYTLYFSNVVDYEYVEQDDTVVIYESGREFERYSHIIGVYWTIADLEKMIKKLPTRNDFVAIGYDYNPYVLIGGYTCADVANIRLVLSLASQHLVHCGYSHAFIQWN